VSIGGSLSDQLGARIGEIKEAVAGLSDEQASSPQGEGEWCVKEVLSHILGDQATLQRFRRFVQEDNPELSVNPGVSYYDQSRQGSDLGDLVSSIESDYGEIGRFLAGVTDEQLARTAHVPLLKQTPLGEYPTLAQWAGFLVNVHLTQHVGQLRALT